MVALFVILAVLTVFSYAIYPIAVAAWARIAHRTWDRTPATPRVTLIISVYNEEAVIREKIENALALDYPRDAVEILVVSDGSTDRTTAIVEEYRSRGVQLLASPQRQGKTACLNEAVPRATGDLVVFTDANAMFPPATLRAIARNFSDPAIGLVTGWTKYQRPGSAEESTGLYARLERATKESESLVSSCVGADGAAFAIRRPLYKPLRNDDINDFVIPLDVIGQGYRAVLDADVFCIEEPAEGGEREFRRQARITNRALVAIWRRREYLNPMTYGTFAVLLLSHKMLRFLVPFFFVASLACALWLARTGPVYAVWAAGQIVFVLIGVVGIVRRSGGRLVHLCAYFLLTLAAQFVGWMRWMSGRTDVIWRPER